MTLLGEAAMTPVRVHISQLQLASAKGGRIYGYSFMFLMETILQILAAS